MLLFNCSNVFRVGKSLWIIYRSIVILLICFFDCIKTVLNEYVFILILNMLRFLELKMLIIYVSLKVCYDFVVL